MNIWLIQVGEPLPLTIEDTFVLRTGLLADILSQRGHRVTWWASTFDHFTKKHIADADSIIVKTETCKMHLLHPTVTYGKNISVRRIINHWQLAYKFRKAITRENRPDIIVCGFPTIEIAAVAAHYGRKNNVRVVMDARDMWPDTFWQVLPKRLKPLFRLFLYPFVYLTQKAFSQATAITGITPKFVEWGLAYANREGTKLDRAFPLAFKEIDFDIHSLEASRNKWLKLGIEPRDFVISYFGTLSHQKLNFQAIVEAIKYFNAYDPFVKFVFCGSGDDTDYFLQSISSCKNVIFGGWVTKSEIKTLIEMSDIGLAPYNNQPDYMASIPTKVIEFMCGGLPIVSGLRGELEQLIKDRRCGVFCENDTSENYIDAIKYLQNNSEIRSELAKNSRELYCEKFNAVTIYNQMTDYLEELVALPPGMRG